VTITLIDERSSAEEAGQEPGADIARHLSRHDAVVEIQHIAEWHGVHEALLNQAEKSGASLLVMGAYGHSRLREWVLGGVTRGVLSEAKLPVLVAH
jgi:nucleotide-binding universal stress UspA family protein